MNQKTSVIFVVSLSFAVVVSVLFGIALTHHWFGYHVEDVIEFCEAPQDGLIKEPANTWSNLGFIFVGLYIAWLLSVKKYSLHRNSFTVGLFYPIFYSCLVIFLGPGSMAKHASKTFIGGFFDMLSMYLVASFILSYAVQRFYKLSWQVYTLIFLIILSTCIAAHFIYCPIVFDFFGNTAFAFYLTLGIFFEFLNTYVRKLNHETRWIFYSLGTLLVAIIIWTVSKTGCSLCYPNSLFQGHAVWHLATALALYFLFRFYVSENPEELS